MIKDSLGVSNSSNKCELLNELDLEVLLKSNIPLKFRGKELLTKDKSKYLKLLKVLVEE